MTEWKEKYEKERKIRQEVEGELSIIKATTVLNSPEMREAIRTIKNLETRLAEVLSLEDSHQKLNGKLQERLTEVEEDNKKLANQIDDKINQLRKSGL